ASGPALLDCHFVTSLRSNSSLCSIRPRQSQDMLRDVRENQVGRDRRNLVQAGLPELALDIVIFGKAEPTVRLQSGVGGLPRGISGQKLGHVGLGTAWVMRIEPLRGVRHHESGGFDVGIRASQRELYALVLPDRPVEYHAL